MQVPPNAILPIENSNVQTPTNVIAPDVNANVQNPPNLNLPNGNSNVQVPLSSDETVHTKDVNNVENVQPDIVNNDASLEIDHDLNIELTQRDLENPSDSVSAVENSNVQVPLSSDETVHTKM